jgi:hypothetical protein
MSKSKPTADGSVVIPTEVVEHVHEAALYMLGKACDPIMAQVDCAKPDLGEPFRRFDTMRVIFELTAKKRSNLQLDPKIQPAVLEAMREWAKATADVISTAAGEDREYEMVHRYAAQLADGAAFITTLSAASPARVIT